MAFIHSIKSSFCCKDWQQIWRLNFLIICIPFILNGCGIPTMTGLIDGLNQQTDVELVCDGSSSFLLLLDSMLSNKPDNVKLLLNNTKAYSAYVQVMSECGHPERSEVLSEKAKEYGLRLLREKTGIIKSDSLEMISEKLHKSDKGDVPALFWGAYGWARWISYQQGSPAAVIDLPKIEMIMKRVVELDENFYNGGAHLFLGIYYTLKPAIYGGDPEASLFHFEKALSISTRRFLPVLVAHADSYAKMVFDRELYQKLLEEVLVFDISTAPDLTLSNIIAQKQARKLLNEIDEYF